MSLHRQRVHPEYVDTCFGCRAGTLQFSTEPTDEKQKRDTEFQKGFAAEFHNGDREAYQRLRKNGLQPPRIAGSGHLEKHATTKWEVETGNIAPDKRKLNEALSICAGQGVDPLKASTAPKVA